MLNNLLSKLRQKPYRDAYVKAHVSQGLAHQIAAMRQQRGWSQQDLAEKLSLKSQSAVARMEDPGYGKLSIATLLKLASVFDVALSIRFQPYSRFVRERQDVSAAALEVKPFDQEVRSDAWVHQLAKVTDPHGLYRAANHNYVSGATVTQIPGRVLPDDRLALAS